MTNDSFLALTCVASIGLFFGFILAFAGYRFFLFLLPIWGFFWGFGLGAQSIQALFGEGFLSSITSWVVGFFLGLIFAVLSYLFFAAAVAIMAGSLGYALGVGIMLAIGFDMGFLTWIVGILLSFLVVVGVFVLDLYKWAIIIATSVMGAGVVVGTFLFIFGGLPTSELVANPVKAGLNASPIWWIVGIAVIVMGISAQYVSTRNWTLKHYSRWDEVYPETSDAETFVPASSGGMAPAIAGVSPGSGMMPIAAPPPVTDVPPTVDSSGQPPTGTNT
jgi:hypothetical protein